MEMTATRKEQQEREDAVGPVRVQRARPSGTGLRNRRIGGEGGFTLVEVVMTMVLLSVGIMGLAPVMLAVVQGNRFAQNMSLATALAEDRLEQVLHHPVFAEITEANFPDEAQGTIRAGDPRSARVARAVSVAASNMSQSSALRRRCTGLPLAGPRF